MSRLGRIPVEYLAKLTAPLRFATIVDAVRRPDEAIGNLDSFGTLGKLDNRQTS